MGCCDKRGWYYTISGKYEGKEDGTTRLEYVLFNVYFDDRNISTRILDEYPYEEECISMLNDTKGDFREKILKDLGI